MGQSRLVQTFALVNASTEEVIATVPEGVEADIDKAVADAHSLRSLRLAKDSAFGLGGSEWSKDADRALGMARRIDIGTIGVNGYMPSLGSPFGGVKASGMGREFGPEAIAGYQQLKSIYVME